MLTIRLAPHDEEEWLGENPAPVTFPRHPLYHQWLTMLAEEPVIVNTFNTGTGKTKAAMLRLLRRVRDRQGRLDPATDNVLFIAPTNALIEQHARDIRRFCQENQLGYRVLEITRKRMEDYQRAPGFSEGELRGGAVRHRIFENPRVVDPDSAGQATIFVVNPDIFYYALYFRYGRLDRIGLFQDIFTLCNYIVIDELHYYSPKQLACFLFFMRLSRHYGYIDGTPQRQFCLLTATPEPQVARYLRALDLPIAWIAPDVVPPAAPGMAQPVRALAPTTLVVASLDELQTPGDALQGLIALVEEERDAITRRLTIGEEGAIISGSLWQIQQIYDRLRVRLDPGQIGRITGPESPDGRQEAARRALILATPTVDIGYNFEKGAEKQRQNIDFLLFDARSSDEFLQRLGRAGRVLGKRETTQASYAVVVVDGPGYRALQAYDGQEIDRATLRAIVTEALPPRNDLFAYLQSGALAEAFLPLYRIKQQTATADYADLQDLFTGLRDLFEGRATATFQKLEGHTIGYLKQEEAYQELGDEVGSQLATLQRHILSGGPKAAWMNPVLLRVKKARDRQQEQAGERWDRPATWDWLDQDIRKYAIERARFTFREAFQPPQALAYDPHHLHTSEDAVLDDALRIARFYHATYYATLAEWRAATGQTAPEGAEAAALRCRLDRLRDPDARLALGLEIASDGWDAVEWEQRHAYRLTALLGMTIAPLSDTGHGLMPEIRDLLMPRLVPALVARDPSRSLSALRGLQRRAPIIVYPLAVTYPGLKSKQYAAILGTQALQAFAEIARTCALDRLRPLPEDDDLPFIF